MEKGGTDGESLWDDREAVGHRNSQALGEMQQRKLLFHTCILSSYTIIKTQHRKIYKYTRKAGEALPRSCGQRTPWHGGKAVESGRHPLCAADALPARAQQAASEVRRFVHGARQPFYVTPKAGRNRSVLPETFADACQSETYSRTLDSRSVARDADSRPAVIIDFTSGIRHIRRDVPARRSTFH
ncbi:hypothetical protein EVAR_32460_1 [Eumeta japonica]|uniref:Uncharacterized protein n=1 Tax=Eumeta variegata TaxID=151549 RepID=A0A4C1VKL6_EUMVA|nr:hypothetical protein EVAR_32460_1 [Eumeta japonica]